MVNSNDDHILFLLFWLQQTFNNDTLLIKWFNLKRLINKFSQCIWFGTLFCPGIFPINLKIYTISQVEGDSDLAYELCYFVHIVVNQIPTKHGNLVQLHCICFSGCFKWPFIVINRERFNHGVFHVWVGYRLSLKNISRFILYRNNSTVICLCS